MKSLLVAVLLFVWTGAQVWAECRADQVALRGDWGEARFTVELADTPQARGQGLMFRETMARGAGMLFVYEAPQPASFWMKNTLIPLDMIFVGRNGVVRHIHSNAIPGDLTPIDGGNGIFAVLEINGGLAQRYGMTVGSHMQHPVFVGGPAIWPC